INAVYEEAAILDEMPSDLFFQFAGINHLHWHTVVDKNGIDRTDELIKKMYGSGETNSIVANIKDNRLIFEQVENLHMVPCPYHNYYYYTDKM
ncbi:6-phospho-beta-glucosidase, partial [Clostridioides difficile]|nr:6-phospho-beta-glucosidase [Clostridioides difficile]